MVEQLNLNNSRVNHSVLQSDTSCILQSLDANVEDRSFCGPNKLRA